jgi:GWxTD domain-containing protein
MRARVVVALALIALPLFAANLGKYRGWPESPQGYFMTKGERAEWSKLASEADAAQFVDKFLAARAPRFAADVAAAAKDADDHLTVAGKKGSQTLRGKIVILLGHPATVTIAPWSGDKSATMATHLSTGVPHPQPVMNLPPSTERTSELRKRYSTDYKLVYAKRTIVVAVNPTTGDDRILDARAARDVGKLLEAAAEASRVTH